MEKFAERAEHTGWRFTQDPPLLTRIDDATAQAVLDGVEEYADNCLTDELRQLLSRYSVADIAHRVVGLGSVGRRSYVVLLHGNGEDSLVLQMEAGPSALAPYAQPVPYEHDGERIVHGQRWMQTVSDIFLGWTTIDGRPFLVRQFRDMKGSIDPVLLKPNQLDDYARWRTSLPRPTKSGSAASALRRCSYFAVAPQPERPPGFHHGHGIVASNALGRLSVRAALDQSPGPGRPTLRCSTHGGRILECRGRRAGAGGVLRNSGARQVIHSRCPRGSASTRTSAGRRGPGRVRCGERGRGR